MRRARAAAAALLFLTSAGASSAKNAPAAAVSFEVDPRIELLSAALTLGDPDGAARRLQGVEDAYAREALAAFSPAAAHPAVARLAELRKLGVAPKALASLMLQVSDPPGLAPTRPVSQETLAALGGGKEAGALLVLLRDFAKRSNFGAFFAAHRTAYRAFADAARADSLRTLSPASAAEYAGRPFTGEQRFVLAPLWPEDPADDDLVGREGSREYRLRPRGRTKGGALGFLFDTFERSTAHELCVASWDWIRPPSPAISALLADAVGLRVIAQDLGEAVYRGALRRPSLRQRPQLEAVAESLKEYESARARYPTLEAFYPRLGPLARLRLDEAARAAQAGNRDAALASVAEALKGDLDAADLRQAALLLQDLKEYAKARALLDGLVAASPSDAGLRVDRAALAAREGDRKAALDSLAEAEKLSPSAAALGRMALLYQDLGEFARALAPIDALIKASPRDVPLRLDRAAAAARAGDRESALKDLGAARRLAPDPPARRRMARLYEELKDYPRAQDLLDGLIKESPADPGLRLGRAYLAARAGDSKASLNFLGEARALAPDADVRRRIDALDQELRVGRASSAAQAGDREAELKFLDEARALKPDADARRRMAALYQQLGDFAQAKGLLDGLLKEAPGDAGLRLDLAALAAQSGDRDAALTSVAETLAARPGAADLRRAALLLQDLKEYPKARALLDGLVAAAPSDAGLRVDRAALAAREGDRKAALDSLAEAEKLSPSAAALGRMALQYQDLGEFARALAPIDALIKASPRDVRLRLDRAAAAARAGDRESALKDLDTASRLEPDRDARHRMALIRQDLKDYEGALSLLRPLAKEKADASVLGDLGVCEFLAGRPDAAVSALRAAIKLEPAALPPYFTLATIYAGRGELDKELGVYDSVPPAGGDPELRALLAKYRREAADRARPEGKP